MSRHPCSLHKPPTGPLPQSLLREGEPFIASGLRTGPLYPAKRQKQAH